MSTRVVTFHAATLAVSEYSLPWTDVVQVGGEIYGLGPDGIQTLSGPIEAGATPYVETGDLELTAGAVCGVTRGYLQGQTNSTLTLTATARMQGKLYEQSYSVPGWPWAESRPRTVPLARHLQGSTWQFKLESSGAPWSIDLFEIAIGQVLRTR